MALPEDFDTFYQQQLDKSERLGTRPNNEEKLLRFSEGKTPIAILYIHGFTASRGEGEFVVDSIAREFGANTYYMRLPGHGTNKTDHATATFRDYLDEAITTLRMMRQLGDKVVIVGTSMGGLLATYLCAEYPDLVDGLILTSPFYEYTNKTGRILRVPGALQLVIWASGEDRPMERTEEFKAQITEGYDNYWYPEQYYAAIQHLEDLRNFAARDRYYKKVDLPVLLLAYYKDEQNQDGAAHVAAMKEVFEQFPSQDKKLVLLPDANHVMLSAYVRSDKDTIINTMRPFLQKFE